MLGQQLFSAVVCECRWHEMQISIKKSTSSCQWNKQYHNPVGRRKKIRHRSKMKMILLFFSFAVRVLAEKKRSKVEKERKKKLRKKTRFFHSAHRLCFYCTHTLTHRDRIGWNGEKEQKKTIRIKRLLSHISIRTQTHKQRNSQRQSLNA